MGMYKDETELLQAAIRGDNEAFGLIVEKYQSLICAITLSATNNLDKSEELAQQVFVNAWQNLKQLRDITKFRNWLCTIAHNVINHALRDQKRDLLGRAKPMDEDISMVSQDHGPAENVSLKEQQKIVASALSHLSEDYRQVLVLFYREEKSVKMVAEQLAISEDTVKTRLFRGREMVKENIEAMLENTLASTKPGKIFTAAVMAGIAGIAITGSGTAAAVTLTASGSGTAAAGGSAVLAGLTAKIVTVAAVVIAVSAAATITYKHFANQNPVESAIVTQEQKEEPKELAVSVQKSEDKTISPLAAATQNAKPPVSEIVNAAQANSVPAVKADTNSVVGGFVRSEDGKPIPDVNVQLLWDVKRGMPMLDGRSTATDANGKWQCKVTQEASDISVQLKHSDYFSLFFDYRPSPDELTAQTAVMIMKKGLQISGYVGDTFGNPVASALIMPPDSITSTSAEYGIQDSAKTARTDAAGNFLLKGVKPERQDIAIDANGYGPNFIDVNVTPDMSPLAITLDQGQSLVGIVVDINGMPISGVSVESDRWQIIQRRDGIDFNHKQFKMLRRQTMTDAVGRFSIEHLPSVGEVDVVFVKRPRKFLFSSLQIDMAQNEPQTVTMYPIPTITGTVIDDQTEKPISKFKVVGGCKWEPNDFGRWDLGAKKITSPQGNFSMTKDNFMSGKKSCGFVAARIEANGYLSAQTPWMRIDEKFSPIIVRLKKAKILKATLFNPDGAVLSNSEVLLIPSSSKAYIRNGKFMEGIINSEHSTFKTDANGHCEFSAPAVSAIILVLHSDGYLISDVNNLKDKATLIPWAYVIGVVNNENGTNSNIVVQVASQGDPNSQLQWMSEQTTNIDGSFAFAYIPAIPQKTYYGPPDSSDSLNWGPAISPRPDEEVDLRLGHSQSTDSNSITSDK